MGGKDQKPVFGGGGIFGSFTFQNSNSTSTEGATGGEQPKNENEPTFAILPVPQHSMRKFDSQSDRWDVYSERLETYFATLGCVSDDAKRLLLLNQLDDQAYEVTRSMCAPANPTTKTYNELCNILNQHFVPQIVVFRERKKFYAISKKDDESVVEWLTRIRRSAMNCEFGDSLDKILLDKFVTNLSGKCFERLSEEKATELSLSRAVELAVKYEKTTEKKTDEVNKISTKSAACKHCGYRNHAQETCRFKNEKCHQCGVTGHTKNVCKLVASVSASNDSEPVCYVSDKLMDSLF